MAQEVRVAKTLDVRGMYCPGPVLETAKAIKQINIGEVLEGLILVRFWRFWLLILLLSQILKLGLGGLVIKLLMFNNKVV
jgi:hypothetical protein